MGKLLEERREKLEEVGFAFKCLGKYRKKSAYMAKQAKQWEVMYSQLEEFHHLNGHCMVPFQFDENPALGHWVSKQRSDCKNGIMSDDRLKQLDILGLLGKHRIDYRIIIISRSNPFNCGLVSFALILFFWDVAYGSSLRHI